MKITSFILRGFTAGVLMAAALSVATVAQAPQRPPADGPGGGGGAKRNYPAPTNLKVLPKNLTGAQVRDIMRSWAGYLGVECDECHKADPVKKDARGRPELIFDDDSKPDKKMARIMYTMTEDMKKNYVARVEKMDPMAEKAAPLTCGTCHRGKEDPEEYVIPKRNRRGGPEAMPGNAAMPMGK